MGSKNSTPDQDATVNGINQNIILEGILKQINIEAGPDGNIRLHRVENNGDHT